MGCIFPKHLFVRPFPAPGRTHYTYLLHIFIIRTGLHPFMTSSVVGFLSILGCRRACVSPSLPPQSGQGSVENVALQQRLLLSRCRIWAASVMARSQIPPS